MLILNRGVDEELVFGKDGDVTVKVLSIERSKRGAVVRLGIEAPKNVRVKRGEQQEKGDGT